MNRDYDIDSILAEIKQKKASAAAKAPANAQGYSTSERGYDERPAPRRDAPPSRGTDYDDGYSEPRQRYQQPREELMQEPRAAVRPSARSAVKEYEDEYVETRPQRGRKSDEYYDDGYAEPRQRYQQPHEVPREEPRPTSRPSARPAVQEYEDDYSPPRSTSRPTVQEYKDDYSPRSTSRPAVQEYEDDYYPSRHKASKGYDTNYAEPSPPRPASMPNREALPNREAPPSRATELSRPDRHNDYEELRPLRRPSFARATSEQYNPADAIFAVASKELEPPEAQEYAPPTEQAPPLRMPQTAEERRRAADDEFVMKYSGLAPLGSAGRKSAISGKESIRTNFGAAAEPTKKGRAQAAKEAPALAEKPQAKPELKGGFRFNPAAEQAMLDNQPASEAFTRLDMPLSDNALSGESFDDTRNLPNGLAHNAFSDYEAAPAGAGDEFLENDELPAKMEMDEYTSPAETQSVKADLDTLRGSLMLRFIISLLCALGLLYMGLAQGIAVPLPELVSPEGAPAVYVLVSLVLLVVSSLVSHTTISNGLVGMFTLKANNDSLAAIAVIGSVIQGTALFLSPTSLANGDIHVYFAVVAIVLLFNIIGKLFTIGRITGNFRFISSSTQKYTVQNLAKRELAREFTWDMNIDEPHVGYSEKVGFIDNFIEQSYAEDSTENIARITVPIIFVGSIVVAVMSYIFNGDLMVALSTFAAVLAIAAPITATIVGSLPQHKAYRALSKCGAALTGYNAVEKFSETNVVIADACELFTSEEVLLHNIKTFEKNRIDEAILDASSVLCVCNGAVKNIFLRIIQGNTKMLRPVENLVYEDAMGISAWVGGKRILIGNSDLMKHHGIDTPSRDYEAKYRTEDRDILYLANSGELTAMFVISYVRNEAADIALGDLERKGISVVVKSVDPNLTAAKIAKIYDLPEEMLRILPAKLHPDFDSLAKERKSDKGYIVHNGTFAGFARAVSAASGVKIATNIGLIIQIVGMVLGYTLVTFFSFMGSMAQATMTTVLLYQLVWGTAVWLFSTLRRI